MRLLFLIYCFCLVLSSCETKKATKPIPKKRLLVDTSIFSSLSPLQKKKRKFYSYSGLGTYLKNQNTISGKGAYFLNQYDSTLRQIYIFTDAGHGISSSLRLSWHDRKNLRTPPYRVDSFDIFYSDMQSSCLSLSHYQIDTSGNFGIPILEIFDYDSINKIIQVRFAASLINSNPNDTLYPKYIHIDKGALSAYELLKDK